MVLQRDLRKKKVKKMAEKYLSKEDKRGKLQERIMANPEELSRDSG